MKARVKFINEKYKLIRFPEEPIYDSRRYHAFFNRFTKSGKKEYNFKQLHSTYLQVKYARSSIKSVARTFEGNMDWALGTIQEPLTMQLARKAKEKLPVIFPQRRNKKDKVGMQRFYRILINERKERDFYDRFREEFTLLLTDPESAPTLRARDQFFEEKVYEGRHWRGRRWK